MAVSVGSATLPGRHLVSAGGHRDTVCGAVHGADATDTNAKGMYHGLKEGSHVVVHYAVKGTEETAEEIDDIGKGAFRVTEGSVDAIDRDAKTISVKTDKGTKETFHLTAAAARDSGKDIGKGAEKSTKVTVYYTEKGRTENRTLL